MADNFRTQKGILAHCARLNEEIVRADDVDTAYVGQPATYHSGSDSYATEVVAVKRNAAGLVTEVRVSFRPSDKFRVKVSANCQSGGGKGDGWRHEAYLKMVGGYASLSLGEARTYLDPSF